MPPSAQKIVKGYLANIENPLDLQKFTIQVFPFETDNDVERYKAVTQAVNDFIGSIDANLSPGLGNWLLKIWRDALFINGSKKIHLLSCQKKILYGLF